MTSLPREVRLWVAGDGPETERLRGRVAGDPRIEWLGRITEDEKRSRLRGADVYCAPSLRGESFGVVLLEAMAASTAIVASDLAGYRRVARPDQDAVLVPPGDAEALAAALRVPAGRPGPGRGAGGLGRGAGAGASPWTAWPTATSSSTSGPVRAGAVTSAGPTAP